MNLNKSTEEAILEAAKEIFQKKGLAGARMQEIANKAGINKALLHYYYRSKEKLFQAVFHDAVRKFFPQIGELINSEKPLFEKIETLVHSYIDILLANPHLPAFVLHEISQNPEELVNFLKGEESRPNPMNFMMQIHSEIQKGVIRPIMPPQLIINILSLCVFPFAARPMISTVFGMDDETYKEFLNQRKKEVTDFIINSIKAK